MLESLERIIPHAEAQEAPLPRPFDSVVLNIATANQRGQPPQLSQTDRFSLVAAATLESSTPRLTDSVVIISSKEGIKLSSEYLDTLPIPRSSIVSKERKDTKDIIDHIGKLVRASKPGRIGFINAGTRDPEITAALEADNILEELVKPDEIAGMNAGPRILRQILVEGMRNYMKVRTVLETVKVSRLTPAQA